MATDERQNGEGFRPHVIAALALALIPAFALTAMVARAYKAEQRDLAASWRARGETAMERQQPEAAVDAYRTALTYARDDRSLRLRLALALAAAGRPAEARAYLLTLWSTQPGNGPVNLALGRLAAWQADVPAALRFYHNAIEGAWTERAEEQRRTARMELASQLVNAKVFDQAQAELIALAGDPPPDSAGRLQMADLMAQAGLENRALAQYRDILKGNPRDAAALVAAGTLSFNTHNYAAASTYLARAVDAGDKSDAAAQMLDASRIVLSSNPYQRRLPLRERAARASRAFDAARARIAACAAAEPANRTYAALAGEVAAVGPIGTRLRRDPDLLDEVMDLVFRIEEATARCPNPTDLDRAMVLLAASRQSGEQ